MRFQIRILPTLIIIYFLMIGMGFTVSAASNKSNITVFAAASTTNAVTEICKLYEDQGQVGVRTSFASSSTLAKQIANGAPADVYLSANKQWMDYLEKKGVIQKETRFDLLGNRIAIVVPLNSPVISIDIKKGMDIASLLRADGRMAIGDPEHVPAGMYGKKALSTLGLWNQLKKRIAPMKDVRSALVMVERAETPLGLVYTTDAAISKKVRIAGVFPLESHQPIVYPVTIVSGGKSKEGMDFLNFLKTPEARAVFNKYGFEVK